MPAVGDQHRLGPGTSSAAVTANPFDYAQRITEYTAEQIELLQSRLNKQLGPEYLSTRQGPGGRRVHYISADKCINLANEVFGFNGWSSSIQNIQVDFVDEDPKTGRINLGLSVIVRVTLKDGTYHEDIGYGHTENYKDKAAAFEKAKKEGTTDGLKRALRTFGKVLGNCIYDKEYLSRVTKVKAIPTKWDVENLHRHSDFVPIKEEPAPVAAGNEKEVQTGPPPSPPSAPMEKAGLSEFEGEFGSDLFDEADFSEQNAFHPDMVVLDQQPQQQNIDNGPNGPQAAHNDGASRRPVQLETPSKPERNGPVAGQPTSLPPPANCVARPNVAPTWNHTSTPVSKAPASAQLLVPQIPQNNMKTPQNFAPNSNFPSLPNGQPAAKSNIGMNNKEGTSPTKPQSPPSSQATEKLPENLPTGFFSARAAEALNADPQTAVKTAPAFDPHFESPSIRKTAGFNHSTSAPVARNTYQILPPQFHRNTATNSNFIPPSSQSGRAGTPGPMNNTPFASPVAKGPLTTSYRPPIRRSMTANNNNANANQPACQNTFVPTPNGATGVQNTNGKRPPLSDMTNITPGSGDEKRNVGETNKRSKISDSGGSTVQANQPGQQVSRITGASASS
ncbi:hypothetical protein VTO42DRAFT_8798 [Malbranchea cinnamomea]